jgi:hypothetical protein
MVAAIGREGRARAVGAVGAVGALGAVLLLALLAVAALLLAGAPSDPGVAHRSTDRASVTAVSESRHPAPSLHGFHQQPSTRARTVVYGLLAVAIAFGTWAFRRVRVVRSGRPRALRITGLPPGRAPPRLRIA